MQYESRRAASIMLLAALSAAAIAADKPAARFELHSPDAQLKVGMPMVYVANEFGCTGGNTSPPLAWRNAPAGTRSFVVTLFDRDERSTPSGWWHWVLYDIPANVDHLAAGAGAENGKTLPPGALHGRTDLGNAAYHGPCPDKGDPPHRYVFTIYALGIDKLPVSAGSSGAMVTSTTRDSLLGKAVFVAHFAR